MPHFAASPFGPASGSNRAQRLQAAQFNREEDQAARTVGGFEGRQRRAGFDLAQQSFALSSKDVRQARLGNLRQFERQAESLFGGQLFSRASKGTSTFERNISRLDQARTISETGPGFLAGQGFSLQPLGFNIALSEFQDEEDLFSERVAGGFSVDTRKLGGAAPSPFFQPTRTLLSGQIRRRKLTVGGSVIKGPIQAPSGEQPRFSPPSRGTRGQRGRPPSSRAPRSTRLGSG